MEADFWHHKWSSNETGFHKDEVNPMLVDHFDALLLAKGGRIFIPLCGKTLDIGWLLSNGYCVAGAELSELAIEQLFSGLGLEPKISAAGALTHYSATNIDIFAGDVFHLNETILGSVDAVYDRAALVALPEGTRGQYAAHVMKITTGQPQLLLNFEYDQSLMDGPPFSISAAELQQHYSDSYDLRCLQSINISGGLKGKCDATENIWLLQPR